MIVNRANTERNSSARLLLAAATALALGALAGAAVGQESKPTGVAFPSGPTLPEDFLRIELRFSTPLPTPLSIDDLKLIGGDGREIEHAFLDVPLQNADATRVTVLLDPARVKSELAEKEALGGALQAGSTVALVVDNPQLSTPIRKTWQVTASDAGPPRPAPWTFELPRRGTQDPIEIHLDVALSSTADGSIAIRGPDGRRVAGTGRLENGETMWRFVPTRPWRQGTYAVVTHLELDGAAGNRPCGPVETVATGSVPCVAETDQEFQPLRRTDSRRVQTGAERVLASP